MLRRTNVPYVPQLYTPPQQGGRGKTKRAEPLLTSRQRTQAIQIVGQGLKRQGVTSAEVYALARGEGTREQQRRINRYLANILTQRRNVEADVGRTHGAGGTVRQQAAAGRQISQRMRAEASPSGPGLRFNAPSKATIGTLLAGGLPRLLMTEGAKQIAAVGSALVRNPTDTTGRTITGLAQSAIGLPAALGELSNEAGRSAGRGDFAGIGRALARPLEETAIDAQRRYAGSIASRSRRIEKEGAAAEVGDALLAVSAGGALVGKPLVMAARRGSFGAPAQEFFGAPRPRLRYSGGTGVREQELGNRVTRVVAQRAQDSLRARRAGRVDDVGRVAALRPQFTPTEKSILRQNEKRAKRGQAPLKAKVQGEVVPFSPKLEARLQRVSASRGSAQSQIGSKHEQTRELSHGTERELAGLSKKQQRAVFHVTQGLIPLDATPDEVRAGLDHRRRQVIAEQEAQGVREPRVLKKHTELAAIDFVTKHADEIFSDTRLKAFHESNLERSKRLAEDDPGLKAPTAEARRYRAQGEFIGIDYDPPKPAKDADADTVAKAHDDYNLKFATRVRVEAAKRGLPEPAYFKHEKRVLPRLSVRTAGNVSRAMKGVAPSTFALFREGRAVTNPDILTQGLAENIKRKHQWNAVSDVVDEHAYSWSRGKDGQGKSISDLLDAIDKQGLRHEDVAFLNVGRMRKEAGGIEKAEDSLNEALTNSHVAGVRARELADKRDEIVRMDGYIAVPKAVADELLASTRPSGKWARRFGRFQGLQSAGILGLNPSFLEVQVAANTLQSLAGMRGNFTDLVRQAPFYKKLGPERQKVMDEALGIGAYEGSTNQARLGSHAGGMAKATAAVGQMPIVRTSKGTVRVTDINPTKVIFRGDDLQNRAFRRAVFYNDLKRQAYRDMVRDMGHMQAAFRRLNDIVTKGGDLDGAAMRLLDNPRAVEKAARHTDDFLGDYLRFTARERNVAKRALMFYGFMRFSLRTLFYTLPVKHPILGAIALKLGQVHNEELRRLFGRDLPSYALSKSLIFDANGDVARDKAGQPRTVDYARINPLTGPAIDIATEGWRAGAGVLSPLLQAPLNLATGKNVTMNRPLRVEGSPQEKDSFDPTTSTRVVANAFGQSLFPYRAGMQLAHPNIEPGDDALPWDPRPTTFVPGGEGELKQKERLKSRGEAGDILRKQLAPLTTSTGDKTLHRDREGSIRGQAPTREGQRKQEIKRLDKRMRKIRSDQKHRERDPISGTLYYTPEYQRLLDRQNELRRPDRANREKVKRRPLPPQEAADQKREERMQKRLERLQDPDSAMEEKMQKRLERLAAG